MGTARWWVLGCLISVVAGCTGSDESADRAICEAIASVDADSTDAEAARAVRLIQQAGTPDDEVLVRVQDEVFPVNGAGIALAARPDDLEAVCAEHGVQLDLLNEQ